MVDQGIFSLHLLFLGGIFIFSLIGLEVLAVPVNSSLPFVLFNNQSSQGTSSFSRRESVDIYRAGLTYSVEFQRGGFTLGFVNSTPGVYTLGVVMPDVSKVVWEANRDDPVSFNASVRVTSDGDLELRDGDGRLVWSTGTANMNASVVEVQETGNLVVMANETVLWQSFDHPTDTLHVSQTLKSGVRLQSRRSINDPSPGVYTFVMEPGGVVSYSDFSGKHEPYWIQGYDGKDDLASARSNVCAGSVFDGVLEQNGTGFISLNVSCTNVTLSRVVFSNSATQNQAFIRLEYDGNLRSYSALSSNGTSDGIELFDSCTLPQKCYPFGVCSNGECECLNSDGTTGLWTTNCSLPPVQSCNDIPSLDFVSLVGAEYFSNRFLNMSVLSFGDCRKACLFNCSCSAFFFWEESSFCYMTDNVNTLKRVSSQTHVAYIKVSKGSGSGLGSGATIGIVLGCLFLVLVVGMVPLMLWLRRRKRHAVNDVLQVVSSSTTRSFADNHPRKFSYADVQQMTEKFRTVLGSGDLGTVYEGELPEGRKIAVKKLDTIQKGKREFYEEVADLGYLHHWNLVKLLGYCSEGHHRLLVYEYMENGSLDKWIYRDSEDNFLEWELRMGVMLGVARGLAYLHDEYVESIIHLDLKPQNILLDSSFVAKVTDYGVSRLMARDQSYVLMNMRNSRGYLAPEWFGDGVVTEKSDVYSFGIVLLEVISGYRCLFDKDKAYLPQVAAESLRDGRVKELIDPRLKDVEGLKAVSAVKIAFQCLQEDPSLRPTMSRIIQMLEGRV